MLEIWLKHNVLPENVQILNIDVGSNFDQLKIGKKICERHGIHFLKANDPAIQNCFAMAVKFSKLNGSDWVVFFQQDSYGVQTDLYQRLNSRLNEIGFNEKIGFIGVNVYHDDNDIAKIDGSNKWMTSARCFLQKGDGWYRNFKGCRVNYDNFKTKDFLSESIHWVIGACHVKTFDLNIIVDSEFQYFLGVDDMLYQCLLRNKFNVVLAGLDVVHDQGLKLQGGWEKKSTVAAPSLVKERYGRIDHLNVWKKKNGFNFIFRKHAYSSLPVVLEKALSRSTRILYPKLSSNMDTVARHEYRNNKDVKRSDVTDAFFHHDPNDGPINYLEEL